MTPAIALRFFAWGCAAGGLLGAVSGFLRPLARHHPHLADTLFCLCAGWVWLELGFGIFGGDLRMGIFLGVLPAMGLWNWGPGRVLTPVWEGIWKILGIFPRCLKKFVIFLNSYFPIWEKSVTIECK